MCFFSTINSSIVALLLNETQNSRSSLNRDINWPVHTKYAAVLCLFTSNALQQLILGMERNNSRHLLEFTLTREKLVKHLDEHFPRFICKFFYVISL